MDNNKYKDHMQWSNLEANPALKNRLGMCVSESITFEMSVLSLSILVTMACFALEYCKVNAPREVETLTENLQRDRTRVHVYRLFLDKQSVLIGTCLLGIWVWSKPQAGI